MGWKSVTTFLTEEGGDAAVLEAARTLASAQEAHLDVYALGVALAQAEAFYGGTPMFGLSGAFEDAAQSAAAIETVARQRLNAAANVKLTALSLLQLGLGATVADVARFTDIVVAPLPYAPGRTEIDAEIIEACLFSAHRPVLVVPRTLPQQFSKVMVAWNGSPEALRAVRDALPVLQGAKTVEIVAVDPGSRGNEAQGLRLNEMLRRHGCNAALREVESKGASVSQVLRNEAQETGADLMVLGAYSHSRLRQAILGGATRSLLAQSQIPVLLSR